MANTVLVIDDDMALLNLMAFALGKQGWTVLPARLGKEGVDLALKHRPDIVLCDVNLPDVNGFEIGRELRGMRQTAHIPIVFISGQRNKAEDIVQGLDGGGLAYILKPVDPRMVHAKLHAVLRGSR